MNSDLLQSAPTGRPLKFRVPTRCQNGHFRWYFYELSFGESRPRWEESPCKCATHEAYEGFGKAGDDQQFTGLCDKNGREIFEGDILSYPHGITLRDDHVWPHREWVVTAGERKMEVGFHKGCFRIFDRGTERWILLGVANLKEMEVSGHIYE